MKKLNLLAAVAIAALTGGFLTGSAFAQTSTAVKESGKAVGEKVMEGKESAQAAVTRGPKKAVHKAKAQKHEDKASTHDAKAKAAGDQIGK